MKAFSSAVQQLARARIRREIDHDIYKAVSVEFDAADEADKVARMRGVRGHGPIGMLRVADAGIVDKLAVFPHGDAVAGGSGERDGRSWRRRRDLSKDDSIPHIMTQVDKLRAKGLTGKGVKVAVIDTGVSRHPLTYGR